MVAADEGNTIKVRVSFTDRGGYAESLTSTSTEEVTSSSQADPAPTPEPTPNSPATGAPAVTGTAQVGETLTADTSGVADTDGLSGATFSYQWLADDAEIAGATSSTYTLVAADEGKYIKVKVTFTDDLPGNSRVAHKRCDRPCGSPSPNSPASGAPTITGTAQVGETLTC